MPNITDEYLDYTGLAYYDGRIKTQLASKAELQELADEVDDIIAEGGEPNVIETVKVNGTALTPDGNKAVNIDLSGYAETSDLPTDLSDLTNTGADPYATEGYVDANGGKIDSISIDGTAQTIDANKNVALNLSAYAKSTDVSSAISTALANSGDAYQTESDVDTKIETALTSAMTYKGSVATVADLPASGNKVGDFYNITATGENYAWDGTGWDKSGDIIDTSTLWSKSELVAITTAQIDALFE